MAKRKFKACFSSFPQKQTNRFRSRWTLRSRLSLKTWATRTSGFAFFTNACGTSATSGTRRSRWSLRSGYTLKTNRPDGSRRTSSAISSDRAG